MFQGPKSTKASILLSQRVLSTHPSIHDGISKVMQNKSFLTLNTLANSHEQIGLQRMATTSAAGLSTSMPTPPISSSIGT